VTAEGWNGEEILEREDAASGARIVIALHSSRLGPASGGTRMKPYSSLDAAREDARRLSEGMTCKWAAAGFPRGGGKAVIAVPPELGGAARDALLRRYGSFIQELAGRFWTGADVGTSSRDMDVIAETGAPYVFSRTPEHGGAGDSAPWTALGVEAGIRATCARLFGDPSLAGRRIVVQGAGSVGGMLIERLLEAGAAVAFSDVSPASVRRYRDERGVPFVDPGGVLETPCDVLAPCALGGILDAATIPRLACCAVAGAANNQLAEPGDAVRLGARGILYAPDFVINAGGAVGITGQESLGWPAERARHEVLRIGATLERVYALAEAQGITTDAAARRIAEERLSRGH
jgi:glutamate dehydrogenase/leucine dehydrogenase